jgi:hypothetical protein
MALDPVIRGADLFQEALTPSLVGVASAVEHSIGHRIQAGDLLLPRVTRRPCARLAGPALAGAIALDSVIVIRPHADGVTPQALADFLSSPHFFSQARDVMARLHDSLRFDLAALRGLPCVGLGSSPSYRPVAVLMDRLARDLIRVVAKDQVELWNIEWRTLEHVVATACGALGFEVELTPASKDGGKDIVLTCWESGARRVYAVEIKHWTSGKRVSGTDLRKFWEVVVADRFDLGLFLSTSGYGRGAMQPMQHIEHRRLRVAGAAKMADLCRMFVLGESGMWVPQQAPTQLLLEGTSSLT